MARRKKTPKRKRRTRRFKVRILRRDRFGRFNKRGRTVQRIKVRVRRLRRPRLAPEAPVAPPPGALSLVDAGHPNGRFAFLARDQRPDIPDTFMGKDVTAALKFGYTDPKTGKTFDVDRVISFEGGEDEDEFWDNYYQAVREELDHVSETADTETGGRYSRFGISVTHFA